MGFKNALRQLVFPMLPTHGPDDEPMPITNLNMGEWLSQTQGRDAMFSVAYVACELAKMRPISALPVHVFHTEEHSRTAATDPVSFNLQNLLQGRWNPVLKSGDGIRWVMITKDTLGSAYARIEWGLRQGWRVPVAIWPLQNTVQKLWDDESRTLKYQYPGDYFTPQGTYLDNEIIEFRSPLTDTDWTHGRSLAEAASTVIGLSIDLDRFYDRLLHNGTHFPRWLETDERLSARDRQELAESISDTAGVLHAGVLRIFDKGLKLRQSEASMTDLALLEEYRKVLQDVCRITGVPPNEVYDNSQLTYSGNVEMSAIQFATKTLMPECRELETVFDGVLRSAGNFNEHVKWDINGLLRGQYADRMKGYQIGVFSGFYSRNEVREWEEMNPLTGLEKPMMPVNYYLVDENGALEPPPKQEGDLIADGAPGAAGDEPSLPSKFNEPNPVLEDMRARIRERVKDTGDTPKTRDFAARVLMPWARACALGGIPFDLEREIEELMRQ